MSIKERWDWDATNVTVTYPEKYVVMQKALGRRRVPVRGYPRKGHYVMPHTMEVGGSSGITEPSPAVEDFKQLHNLKDLTYKGFHQPFLTEGTIPVLDKEFKKIDETWHFDGRGKLEVDVRSFSKGKRVSVKGQYKTGVLSGVDGLKYRHILEIDKRYVNTIPHEYAHFIFNDNGWNINRETLAPMLGLVSSISKDILKKQIGKEFDEFQTRFEERIDTFPAYPHIEAAKGLTELFVGLKTFYTSDEFINTFVSTFELMAKTMNSYSRYFRFGSDMLDYLFKPTELFARVCGAYVEKEYPESFKFMIDNPDSKGDTIIINCEEHPLYMKIVNEWGDKYLKTGIIKSLIGGS